MAGNWLEEKKEGSSVDQRIHDAQNKITSMTGVDPDYDQSGNMTKIPIDSGQDYYYTIIYDAWNRPVKVKFVGIVIVAEYEYDGLGRVVKRDFLGSTNDRHYYYNTSWQVLAERTSTDSNSTNLKMEYVWGVQYVDEIVCRIDHSGENPVREEFVQDTNWNVITLLSSSGGVEERYRYDPYGKPVFMNSSGTEITTGIKNKTYLFQGRRLIEWSYSSSNTVQTYHFRNREYGVRLGRFLQRDPIGVWGDGVNLGNGYGFVGGMPLSLIDPLGLHEASIDVWDSDWGPDDHVAKFTISFKWKCVKKEVDCEVKFTEGPSVSKTEFETQGARLTNNVSKKKEEDGCYLITWEASAAWYEWSLGGAIGGGLVGAGASGASVIGGSGGVATVHPVGWIIIGAATVGGGIVGAVRFEHEVKATSKFIWRISCECNKKTDKCIKKGPSIVSKNINDAGDLYWRE